MFGTLNVLTLDQDMIFCTVQSAKCAQQSPNGGPAAALGLPGIPVSIIPGWTGTSAFRAPAAAAIAKRTAQD